MSTSNHEGRALVELASDTCWSLLRSQEVGRLGVIVRHWPLIVPVNYRLDEQTVVIRTAGVVAAADHANVTFQIDQVDPLSHTGWSVLIRGLAQVVGEHHRPWIAERTHRAGVAPWVPGDDRSQWVRILTQQVTGRRITAGELTPDAEEWGYR